jgi:NADP-dependent 3-hydroxy acid dehydrogenase YdfG
VVAPGATATEAFPGDLPVDPARLCRAEDIAAAIRFIAERPASANVDRLVIAPPGGPL